VTRADAAIADTLEAAEPLSGPRMASYCALARRHGVWLSLGGVQERSEAAPGKVHNTHVLVDDSGALRAAYRKVHLFDVDVPGSRSYRESAVVAPGEELVVCASPVGALGLSVVSARARPLAPAPSLTAPPKCYDVRFPALYTALRDAGAEVLLVPAAFTVPTGLAHWEVLLRARAIENQCYVAAAAQHGDHNVEAARAANTPPRQTFGHSLVADAWGAVVAQAADGVGVAVAEIDLDALRRVREALPVQRHARPAVYASPPKKA
jgi:predicted amidohydrolase